MVCRLMMKFHVYIQGMVHHPNNVGRRYVVTASYPTQISDLRGVDATVTSVVIERSSLAEGAILLHG